MHSRLPAEDISLALSLALAQTDLISPSDSTVIFYDLSHLTERVALLFDLFPGNTVHAVAIKANPLTRILAILKQLGTGFEAATLPELYLAEKTTVEAKKIVFDSPVKTIDDINYALQLGCHLNADSLPELDRLADIIGEKKCYSTVGIRVNPQVGIGSIEQSSVAGFYSKFGVPLSAHRQQLIECYLKYPWLTGVHVHVGSQGCPLDMLLDGIGVTLDFANEVNQILQQNGLNRRISIFDIGGGLPVAYRPNSNTPTLQDYVEAIKKTFGQLFTGEFKLITEFGRYLHANAGWVATRVEYIKREAGINTAMIHVGADLFVRKCYCPDYWHHEILVLDKSGKIKTGLDTDKYTVAGPLCFAGDVIAKEIPLPVVEPGDFLVIQDTGAYTLAMWSRYNSRQIPKVVGYYNNGDRFEVLKDKEKLSDIADFWS